MAKLPQPPISSPMFLDESKTLTLAWSRWFQAISREANDNRSKISDIDLSEDAVVDLTKGIDGSNDVYEIDLIDVRMSSPNSALLFRASSEVGVVLEASNMYQYDHTFGSSGSSTAIELSLHDCNNIANYELNGYIRIIKPFNSDRYKLIYWTLAYVDSSDNLQVIQGAGQIRTLDALIAFRILPNAGVLTSGTIKFYSLQ